MNAQQQLEVEWWPIEKVIPTRRNPRDSPRLAVAKVAASIAEFSWRQPIVVDEEGVVVVGHTRLLAARQLGLERVPVHVARGLTAAQVKAYRIADNRTAAENDWDLDLLPLEIADLKLLDADLEPPGLRRGRAEALLGAAAERGPHRPRRGARGTRGGDDQARRPLASGRAPSALRRQHAARKRSNA